MKTRDSYIKAFIDNKSIEKTGKKQRGKSKMTRRFMVETIKREIRKKRMEKIKGTFTPITGIYK